MRTPRIEPKATVADILSEQLEKFLKRLESQDYAPSGVLHYRRRLSEFCAEVKASRMRLKTLAKAAPWNCLHRLNWRHRKYTAVSWSGTSSAS